MNDMNDMDMRACSTCLIILGRHPYRQHSSAMLSLVWDHSSTPMTSIDHLVTHPTESGFHQRSNHAMQPAPRQCIDKRGRPLWSEMASGPRPKLAQCHHGAYGKENEGSHQQ